MSKMSLQTRHDGAVHTDILSSLNKEQKEAVLHTGRPLLILAGAGSGKTRVITTKIAYLIRECHVHPRSILAVTFTNKAANEMAQRASLLEERASLAMMRTFHSFGAWFLRRYSELAGIKSSFTIYDDDDSAALLATVLPGKKKQEVKLIAAQIAKAKDFNLSCDSAALNMVNGSKEFRKYFKLYEEKLLKTGNVDFGDLIKKPVEILRNNGDIKARIQERFSVILVDEYQDANIAQAELLEELSSERTYLCVVGDDDQSIYRFRGAEVRNILKFPKMRGGADIIKLETNYRSTSYILELAASVVRNNSGRLGKTLRSARGAGKKPRMIFLEDSSEECTRCADMILDSVALKKEGGGGRFSDWALLYRTNAQSLGFENEFLRREIPYKIVGSLKFYEREEIKDAIALLSFMQNPKDEISFRRIINKPARGLGAAAVERILQERFNTDNWDIEETLRRILPSFSKKPAGGAAEFLASLEAGRASFTGDVPACDKNSLLKFSDGLSCCIAALLLQSGIAQYHKMNDEAAGETRLANLQELVNNAVKYERSAEGLSKFLEAIELDRSLTTDSPAAGKDGEDNNFVTLITVHNTKGLEFNRVIMTGMEQGLFPRYDKYGEDLEEERRLFYVGSTRAKDELYFTTCRERMLFGRHEFMSPSLFLEEAAPDALEVEGAEEGEWEFAAPPPLPPPASKGGKLIIPTASKGGKIIHHTQPTTNHGKRKTSKDGLWSLGDIVFSEDLGQGEVVGIRSGEDEDAEDIIKVNFFNAGKKEFLSYSQRKRYMKIST